MARSAVTRNTLSKIMEILTTVQRTKWNTLNCSDDLSIMGYPYDAKRH
ncbi:MAG: hypothetical protein WCK15_15695 [Pirellula sp.]